MAQELIKRGICDTCMYRSDCLSLKNSIRQGKSVWHCEQFEDSLYKNPRERWELVTTSFILPGISMKRLIPGWGS